MKAAELMKAIVDLMNSAGIPVTVKVVKEAEEEEEEKWEPMVDENGLMNDVEELRDLIRVIHSNILEFIIGFDAPRAFVKIRALELAKTLRAAHDLVCDCHRKEEKTK